MPRRTFEAMFAEGGVSLDDALSAELHAAGLDLSHPRPAYPLALLRAMIDVVRRHAFAALPPEEGFREVGRRWVLGFKHTPLGWVFRASAPLFGPDRTLQTLPRYLTSVREDLPLRVYQEGAGRYRLVCADARANAHFLAGCLEVLLATAGVDAARVQVKPGPPPFELEVSWT